MASCQFHLSSGLEGYRSYFGANSVRWRLGGFAFLRWTHLLSNQSHSKERVNITKTLAAARIFEAKWCCSEVGGKTSNGNAERTQYLFAHRSRRRLDRSGNKVRVLLPTGLFEGKLDSYLVARDGRKGKRKTACQVRGGLCKYKQGNVSGLQTISFNLECPTRLCTIVKAILWPSIPALLS